MMSTHNENIMKRRKNKGKKHNLSIHQFDEETQKTIQETIEQQQEQDKLHEETSSKLQEFKMVTLVEDHILPSINKESEAIKDDQDYLNDRDESDCIASININQVDEPIDVRVIEQEDGEKIMGRQRSGLDFQDIPEIISQKDEQDSIEIIDKTDEVEKRQDYKLLDKFFSFLDKNSAGHDSEGLNFTLSGYFCKVVQVIIKIQPKEVMKYVIKNDYAVLEKLVNHIDNKSICELLIKILFELTDYNQSSLPGITDVQAVLQQSGQSGDENAKTNTSQAPKSLENENHKKVQQIILKILDEKINEDTCLLTKLGAIEVLMSLLSKKIYYQTLTSKKAFQIIMEHLVSKDKDTMKFVYILMIELIQCYEKHERLEKRINIDNFEDDELMIENSNSFGRKSKNSKKQNQEVLKDIMESELFHFFKVVIQEVTSSEIEDKFEELQSADEYTRVPLGSFFMTMIEFLEKASSTFCGFQYDINQMIIEKDLFIYLFDILEYYKYSDFLHNSVFKIIENILKAKNDDIQEMVRYMIEDTPLIKFLINNKPKFVQKANDTSGEKKAEGSPEDVKESSPKNKQQTEDGEKTKSPEQSKSKSQIIQEQDRKSTIQQLQLVSVSGLQAYAKGISKLINDFYQRDKSQDSINSKEKNNSKSAGNENSQQSGDQSKSSIVETDEEIHNQKVSKIIVAKLKDNEQWRSHITNYIEPLLELEKGKLCKDEEKQNDSANNIFDDDFMRSDFAVHDSTTGQDDD